VRIAVTHNLPPGGAARRLQEQARNLDAEVVEVCLEGAVAVTADPIVVPYRALAPRLSPVVRPPVRYVDLGSLAFAWRRVRAELDRIRPDVVFVNPCRFLHAPTALVGSPAPSLYHCDEPGWAKSDPAMRASRNTRTRGLYAGLHGLERALDRVAVRAATSLTTNSRNTAASIFAIYGRNAQVLPCGVPEWFTPTYERARHLLSVGTLIPDKGHEIVLHAAARARDRWPVVIVAPRPDPNAQRALLALAHRLGVELTVRTAIPDVELVRAYRGAHATLYLAREEPFGLASLEAQACGCPVIVAAEGGLPETMVDGTTGWAVPRGAPAAAARLDELRDAQLRDEMARAAAEHAAKFSWPRAGAALQRTLTKLAEHGRG
jgi:glycosyltransferase involved in cell wall biosynthesis